MVVLLSYKILTLFIQLHHIRRIPLLLPGFVRDVLLCNSSDAVNKLALICLLEKEEWAMLAGLLLEIGIDDVQISVLFAKYVQWLDEKW